MKLEKKQDQKRNVVRKIMRLEKTRFEKYPVWFIFPGWKNWHFLPENVRLDQRDENKVSNLLKVNKHILYKNKHILLNNK